MDFIEDKGNGSVSFPQVITGAQRAASWTSAYHNMIGSPAVDADRHTGYLKYLWQLANSLQSATAVWNGQAIRANGLAAVAVYFPEFVDAARWRGVAETTSANLLNDSFEFDGVWGEQTVMYHDVVLRYLYNTIATAAANGVAMLDSPTARARLERAYGYLMDVMAPDGRIPAWGDADRLDQRYVLRQGFELFPTRTDFQYVANAGASGAAPGHTSTLYPGGRVAIMRTGWDASARFMAIENARTVSHGHPDDLSLVASAYGNDLLVDPGRYSYLGGTIASYMGSTAAHNTVMVNGTNQAAGKQQRTSLVANGAFDSYDGRQDDYQALGISHGRKVFFAKRAGIWIVSDVLSGGAGSNTGTTADVATALKVDMNAGASGDLGYYYSSNETAPTARAFASYRFDGRSAYVETTAGGTLRLASIVDGSTLSNGAVELIDAAPGATIDDLTVSWDGSAVLKLTSSLADLPVGTVVHAPAATSVQLNGEPIPFSKTGDFVTVGSARGALLSDDFSDGDAAGWTPTGGTWGVSAGGYRQSDAAATVTQSIAGDASWTNYGVAATVTPNALTGSSIVGLFARYRDADDFYLFDWYRATKSLRILKKVAGTVTTLATVPMSLAQGRAYRFEGRVIGDRLTFLVDGVTMVSASDSALTAGRVGVRAHTVDVTYDDVVVTQAQLFADDFADGDATGWTPTGGTWTVSGGAYRQTDTSAVTPQSIAGNAAWDDYTVSADVTVNAITSLTNAGLYVRYRDADSFYIVDWTEFLGQLRIVKKVAGTVTTIASTPFAIARGATHRMSATVVGDQIVFAVDGVVKLRATDASLSSGAIGARVHRADVSFDNVRVR